MFKKQFKKMKMLDWGLVKLGVAVFMLFLVGIWPSFRNWVLSVNPLCFLAVSLIAVAVVEIRVLRK